MKVDVHCLHIPSTDMNLWKECQSSLLGEPINLHIVQGIVGNIEEGRVKGFRIGNSPYVSFVDPDDIVLPGAFASCIEALEKNKELCGAFTDELLINGNGDTTSKGIWSGKPWHPLKQLDQRYLHHVTVMRRCYVEKYYDDLILLRHLGEYILKALITEHGPWMHVNHVGYKWRVWNGGAHVWFSNDDIHNARWKVIPLLQKAAVVYNNFDQYTYNPSIK